MSGLGVGLLLALLAIFLMLTASIQSFRLSLVTVAAARAVVAGAALMLWGTGSTLNIQSFIGVIMGLERPRWRDAILVVTFAGERRRNGESSKMAAENAVVCVRSS